VKCLKILNVTHAYRLRGGLKSLCFRLKKKGTLEKKEMKRKNFPLMQIELDSKLGWSYRRVYTRSYWFKTGT